MRWREGVAAAYAPGHGCIAVDRHTPSQHNQSGKVREKFKLMLSKRKFASRAALANDARRSNVVASLQAQLQVLRGDFSEPGV